MTIFQNKESFVFGIFTGPLLFTQGSRYTPKDVNGNFYEDRFLTGLSGGFWGGYSFIDINQQKIILTPRLGVNIESARDRFGGVAHDFPMDYYTPAFVGDQSHNKAVAWAGIKGTHFHFNLMGEIPMTSEQNLIFEGGFQKAFFYDSYAPIALDNRVEGINLPGSTPLLSFGGVSAGFGVGKQISQNLFSALIFTYSVGNIKTQENNLHLSFPDGPSMFSAIYTVYWRANDDEHKNVIQDTPEPYQDGEKYEFEFQDATDSVFVQDFSPPSAMIAETPVNDPDEMPNDFAVVQDPVNIEIPVFPEIVEEVFVEEVKQPPVQLSTETINIDCVVRLLEDGSEKNGTPRELSDLKFTSVESEPGKLTILTTDRETRLILNQDGAVMLEHDVHEPSELTIKMRLNDVEGPGQLFEVLTVERGQKIYETLVSLERYNLNPQDVANTSGFSTYKIKRGDSWGSIDEYCHDLMIRCDHQHLINVNPKLLSHSTIYPGTILIPIDQIPDDPVEHGPSIKIWE